MDGAEWAGISLLEQGRLVTRGATDQVVEDIDRHQYELDEGPCVSSNRNARTIRADDLRDEPRWPRFADAAVRLGVQSMLAVQLFDDERKLGALNLYAAQPDSFDETAETTAILLASHAALAIAEQRDVSHLRFALDARDLVGQAKGILMEHYHISAAEAFDLLATSSQHQQPADPRRRTLIKTGNSSSPLTEPSRPPRFGSRQQCRRRRVRIDRASKNTKGKNTASLDPGSLYTIENVIGARKVWTQQDTAKRQITGHGVTVALLDSGTAAMPGLTTPGKLTYGPDLSIEGNGPRAAKSENPPSPRDSDRGRSVR